MRDLNALTHADVQALIAYLRILKQNQQQQQSATERSAS